MYSIRKSLVDPSFVEIYDGEKVVEEVFFSPILKRAPSFETVEAAKYWLENEEKKRARNSAVFALSQRDLPSTFIAKKLKEKKFSDKAIQNAIGNLPFDDSAFWERTVEREWKRGYGPYKIEEKWRRHGMPKGYAHRIISTCMQQERIESAFKTGKDKAKVARSLIYKGFDSSLVEKNFRLQS